MVYCAHMQSTQRVRYILFAVAILTATLVVGAVSVPKAALADTSKSDLPLSSYSYTESFESVVDPFIVWAKNTDEFVVHEKVVTSEISSDGTYSMKFDVTLPPNSYVFWRIPTERIPSDYGQELVYRSKLFVTANPGTIGVGINVRIDPPNWTGTNQLGGLTRSTTTQWYEIQADLITGPIGKADSRSASVYGGSTREDYGLWNEWVAVLLSTTAEGGRFTFYLDDISITGTAPDVAEYQNAAEAAWASYGPRVRGDVANMANAIKAFDASMLDSIGQAYIANAKSRSATINASTVSRGYPTPEDWEEVTSYATALPYLLAPSGNALDWYPWDAVGEEKVLPGSFPVRAERGAPVRVQAARGEVESASFVLRANESVQDLSVSVSDLSAGAEKTLPGDIVDVRLVESWYQAGEGDIWPNNDKVLVPELLVKDDNLMQVNEGAGQNILRIYNGSTPSYIDVADPSVAVPDSAEIHDADVLQPFDIDAHTNRQVWLTVRVPETASAGVYSGTITITGQTDVNISIPVRLVVYPFVLEDSPIEHSMYYRGLVVDPVYISSNIQQNDGKTEAQYRIDHQNMLDHGVVSPTFVNSPTTPEVATRALEIRQEVGMPADNLYVMTVSSAHVVEGLLTTEELVERANLVPSIADQFGYQHYFFYGKDEVYGEAILAQVDAWNALKANGYKIFAAITGSTAQYAAPYLDLANINGSGYSDDYFGELWLERFKDAGTRTFMYGNRQVGVEDPYMYRKNYGLLLVRSGYDGAMNYAYQHGFDDIWNDFDHSHYRDHVFAYPITDGVIDTIQWEGYREAVDDTRYLATLAELDTSHDWDYYRGWVKDVLLEHNNDPDAAREEIVTRVFEVSSLEMPTSACADTLDNDNDGLTDYPNDPGCESADDTDETDPTPTLAADFNADNTVNIFDYNLLLMHFGATADCDNPADANSDCDVDIFDYNVLLGEFGMSV